MNGRTRYAGMQSILEVPPLNEKYWSKIPEAAADAVMLDLEDSAPADQKVAARDRVLAGLANPAFFGERRIVVRVNNLSTPWGKEDLQALARCAGELIVCYPKAETEEELAEAVRLSRGTDATRGIYAMVETARAVVALDRVAAVPGLVGLHFGYGDFAADVGCQIFNADGDNLHPAMDYARAKVATTAAAQGLFSTGGSMVPDYKDLVKVSTFVRSWVRFGYTACIALSPSHLEIVAHCFRPTAEEVAEARELCAVFLDATTSGKPNAMLKGKVVTTPNYRNAMLLLARAGIAPAVG